MRHLLCGLVAVALSGPAFAVPVQLTHQGRLLDQDGNGLSGEHDLTFTIYDASFGGTALYQETITVTFEDGAYSTVIGTHPANPLDDSVFDIDGLFLAVAVDGGPDITARQFISQVPFAARALTASNVIGGTVDAAQILVDGSPVIDGTGTFVGDLQVQTIGSLTCGEDGVAVFDGTRWVCGQLPDAQGGGTDVRWVDLVGVPAGFADNVDNDALAAIATCLDDQVVYWNQTFQTWGCRDDRTPSSQEIRSEVSAAAIDLASGSTVGLQPISTGPHLTIPDLAGEHVSVGTLDVNADAAVGTLEVDGDVSVGGALRLGGGGQCTGATAGGIRWNPSAGEVQVCDGDAFVAVAQDMEPNAIDIGDLSGQLGERVESAPVTLSGFTGTLLAVAHGEGASIKLADGTYVPAAQVSAGDTVSLAVDLGMEVGTSTAALSVGTAVAAVNLEARWDNATCRTLRVAGATTDGEYEIDPDGPGGKAPMTVWCDMGGGGWTYAAENEPFVVVYTGGPQHFTSPLVETTYVFTLYGAGGGPQADNGGNSNNWRRRSAGGRASGEYTMAPRTHYEIWVGGMGMGAGKEDDGECHGNPGGFNGGGDGSRGGSAGGGATDVRVGDSSLYSRILVAGGGGGCGNGQCQSAGGNGGGLTGGDGAGNGGTGGTQTAGGAPLSYWTGDERIRGYARGGFGYGGSAIQCNDEGGGGGGWYGGGAGGVDNRSAGGGSSYIGGVANGQTSAGQNENNGYAEYVFR